MKKIFNWFKERKNNNEVHTYKITYDDDSVQFVTIDKIGINNMVVNDYYIKDCEKVK